MLVMILPFVVFVELWLLDKMDGRNIYALLRLDVQSILIY